MKYEVRIVRAAEKEMDKLPGAIHARISTRILSLEDNPRPRGAKKLTVMKNTASEWAIIESYILLMTRGMWLQSSL